MNRVFIIGAGGFSKQVIDAFRSSKYKICGIFDNFKKGDFYQNTKIVGNFEDINKIVPEGENLFISLGDNKIRKEIYNEFINYNFPNCFRPNSDVPNTLNIGIGNYIGSYCKLGEDSKIGDFNFINECTIIAHDTSIGNFNHLAPNVSMGGFSEIKDNNLVGTGAIILPKISILNNNIIGAGSVIIKNIENNGTYVGNPAKLIKNTI
jgi:sugar O-acyltransferase (sialic acid O-acetyltransferase NeuD family)